MFRKTYHATHPDMMDGASNDQLATATVGDLFVADTVQLDYRQRALRDRRCRTGIEGGDLPKQTEPESAKGKAVPRAPRTAINIGAAAVP